MEGILTPDFECAALSVTGAGVADGAGQLVLCLRGERAAENVNSASCPAAAHLVAVADGVGRELSGSRASQIILETVQQFGLERILQSRHVRGPHVDLLGEVIPLCQAQLRQEAQLHPDLAPMGSTLTLAYFDWPMMDLVHVGDSRCYLLRPSRLECLTTDHTVAARMVAAGILTAEELPKSRWRNVLWNAVSSSDHATLPDRHRVRLTWGDTFLLCTDGLTKQMAEDEIAQILRQESPAAAQCSRLIDVANRRGGADNVTVIVIRLPAGTDGQERRNAVRQGSGETARGQQTAH